MNSTPKRICPFCAESINDVARICPRCRQWLTIKSFRNPTVGLFCIVIPLIASFVLVAIILLSGLDRLQNPKPNYSDLPDSLLVLESHMNWAMTQDELRIYIAGVFTNTSSAAWKDTEFDCRFFDANGVMIDAGTGFNRVTINPNDDAAFRISITPTAATNSYVSFKISVSHARNARSWF